jgi:hypothetical protein
MADFGYAVADHCSVDPVSARRRASIRWSQKLMDGELRVLIDFVGKREQRARTCSAGRLPAAVGRNRSEVERRHIHPLFH